MKKETKIDYYNNGKKAYETPYINDNRHGLEIWWYKNGNKYSETTFKNDIEHGTIIGFNY